MANYIQDPNDSKKQVPGPPPEGMFDKAAQPTRCHITKQPNYVIVNVAETVSFFFGTSASFATKAISEGNLTGAPAFGFATGSLTGSTNYVSFGAPAVGTKFDINPLAWSGSAAQTVTFVYKGGLDGQGRP